MSSNVLSTSTRKTMELGDVIARLEAVVNHLVTTKVLARLRRNQIGKKMFTTKDTKITKFGV